MILVRIPSALRPYADSQKEVAVDAISVDSALQALTERYPTLKPHLYDETGTLRQYVNLFVNEQDVRSLQGGATPLRAGDRTMIVPSIAGGAHAEQPTGFQPQSRTNRIYHPPGQSAGRRE
jgi:sulfur-carrier protein